MQQNKNSKRAMEPETIQKNGASLKSLMSRINFLFCGILLFGTVGVSQAQNTFSKGDKVVNVGIGFESQVRAFNNNTNPATEQSTKRFVVPPISLSYEQGIIDGLLNDKASIGVGGYLAYTAKEFNLIDDLWGGNTGNRFIIGVRGLFHYQFVNKLDTYTGLMLSYNVFNYTVYGGREYERILDKVGDNIFEGSLFVGARYYFSDAFAAFFELECGGINSNGGVGRSGIAIANVGVSYKF
jgi:hypothetical protein